MCSPIVGRRNATNYWAKNGRILLAKRKETKQNERMKNQLQGILLNVVVVGVHTHELERTEQIKYLLIDASTQNKIRKKNNVETMKKKMPFTTSLHLGGMARRVCVRLCQIILHMKIFSSKILLAKDALFYSSSSCMW